MSWSVAAEGDRVGFGGFSTMPNPASDRRPRRRWRYPIADSPRSAAAGDQRAERGRPVRSM